MWRRAEHLEAEADTKRIDIAAARLICENYKMPCLVVWAKCVNNGSPATLFSFFFFSTGVTVGQFNSLVKVPSLVVNASNT